MFLFWLLGELLWDWTKRFIINGVVHKNLNNASNGLPSSRPVWYINRAPNSNCKDPVFSVLEGKPLSSTFLGVLPLLWWKIVLEVVFLVGGFKFLDKVSRGQFVSTKFLDVRDSVCIALECVNLGWKLTPITNNFHRQVGGRYVSN